jgi:hypothetical protein
MVPLCTLVRAERTGQTGGADQAGSPPGKATAALSLPRLRVEPGSRLIQELQLKPAHHA